MPRAREAQTRSDRGRRARLVLGAIVFTSIALRVVYFLQLNATPLIDLHRWDQTDMHYYEGWGRHIAAGDWLSASVTVPMHDWHVDIANEYFRTHPEERAALDQEAAHAQPATNAETLLWTKWMGGHRFYEDPLYPYLIGVTYRLAGSDVRYVFAWQMAAGVLTNVLIWLLARRFFGDVVAAWAAVLSVLCGPLMYYELILLRESLIVCAGLWLIWLTDRACTHLRWPWFALLGLSIGLACQLKSTFIVLAIVMAAAIIWTHRGRLGALLMPIGAAGAGLVIALTPLAARNVAVGVPPLALASSGPLTFIASNVVGYPVETGFAIDTPRVTALVSHTYGRPLAAVVETLHTHTIGSYAALVWRKWDRAWHWYEIPNNEDFYYMRVQAPVLAWLPVTFWMCGPLGLVGIVIALTRRPRPWLLLALVASALGPLIVFYVLGRFRVALLAALVPFAALTLAQLVRWGSTRRYVALVAATGAVVLLALWTGRDPEANQPLIRTADWMAPFVVKYQGDVVAAVAAHDPQRAVAAFLEYFRYEPDIGQVISSGSRELALDLGNMHKDCAALLRESGQADLAQVHADKADRLLRLAGVPNK